MFFLLVILPHKLLKPQQFYSKVTLSDKCQIKFNTPIKYGGTYCVVFINKYKNKLLFHCETHVTSF